MLDEYRLKQFNDQAKAIDDRTKTKVTRVGDRDTEYGFQNVIAPDGSTSRNGIKTYNADTAAGTPVLATDRSDGLTALTAQKATPSSKVVPKIFGSPSTKEKIEIWALADTYGAPDSEDETFFTYVINLITGATYLVGSRPRMHPGCFNEFIGGGPGSCELVYYGDDYENMLVCTPPPPDSIGPLIPFFNANRNSLSLDVNGRPIVRVRHTVACPSAPSKPYDYENMTVDKYFRLEAARFVEYTGGTNGANLLGDWRYDASTFLGKGTHYDDPFTSLVEPGRVTRYKITSGLGTIVKDALGVALKYVVTGMTNSEPISGELELLAIYRGVGTPANLNIVSIAIRKYK